MTAVDLSTPQGLHISCIEDVQGAGFGLPNFDILSECSELE